MTREYPEALPAGYRLEEYEIVRVLGKGGLAITYLAKDSYRNEEVALKEYFPADCALRTGAMSVGPTAGSRDVFDWGYRRFLDEARILQKFRHPSIPAVYRYFRANGTAYIAMEYIRGRSLSERLGSHGSLPLAAWRPWLDRLLDALEHVHSHEYLHRDITPSNILIRESDDQPVLIDFGAARIATEERTRTVVLTEAYAPIEQHSARAKQGPFTDIYSLAAVSYRVLTGEAPPSAPDRAMEDECVPLAERLTTAPAWMAAVDRALTPAPRGRPQTAAGWRRQLNAAAAKMWLRGPPSQPATDAYGTSPLHRAAAEESNPDVLARLLDGGADIRACDYWGETPLHTAARQNPNREVVALLLDRGADIEAPGYLKRRPLLLASQANASDVVRVLIDRGADVRASDSWGMTPLHLASQANAREVVSVLLDRGLGPLICDEDGRTLRRVILDAGAGDVARLLLDREIAAYANHDDAGLDLHLAALANSCDILTSLLDRGADVHTETGDGVTPLHLAAQGDAREAAKLLLDRGARIRYGRKPNWTPLHSAAAGNALATAELLLEHGADIEARTTDGRTPLHVAAFSNALEVAKTLIDHGADIEACTRSHVVTRTDDRETPLHSAAAGNAVQMTELLLEEGVDVEARTDQCWTPLHMASSEGAQTVAEFLLERGAGADSETQDGDTPLHLAIRGLPGATRECGQGPEEDRQVLALVELLLRQRTSLRATDIGAQTPLTHAVRRPAPEVVDFLVGCGVPTSSLLNAAVRRLAESTGRSKWWPVSNHSDADAVSSLSEVDRTDARNSVLFLLQRGADVNALDMDRRAPIHVAAELGVQSVVTFLLDHGAHIHCRDGDRNTPLHRAAMYVGGDGTGLVRLLLNRGADASSQNAAGKTPLHLTGNTDAYETARALLQAGGDATAHDKVGRTPLHDAAYGFSLSVSGELLEHGAALDARDAKGKTPLHLAIQGDAWELAEMLVERGADTKPIDEYNQDWAEEGAAIEERLSWAKTDRLHRLVSALRASLCTVLQRVADKRGWSEADKQIGAIKERLSDSGYFPQVYNYPSDAEGYVDLCVEELVGEQDTETLYWYLVDHLDVDQTQQVVSTLRNAASLDLYRWREMLCL